MPKKKSTPKKTKSTAKQATKKSTKLENLTQAHGKDESKDYQPTTLDQVWGDTGLSKYGTQDEQEYLLSIKGMNRSDLHSHAVKFGILPVDNRELLTTRLLREFKKFLLAYKKPSKSKVKEGKKTSKKATSILAEGR